MIHRCVIPIPLDIAGLPLRDDRVAGVRECGFECARAELETSIPPIFSYRPRQCAQAGCPQGLLTIDDLSGAPIPRVVPPAGIFAGGTKEEQRPLRGRSKPGISGALAKSSCARNASGSPLNSGQSIFRGRFGLPPIRFDALSAGVGKNRMESLAEYSIRRATRPSFQAMRTSCRVGMCFYAAMHQRLSCVRRKSKPPAATTEELVSSSSAFVASNSNCGLAR
jgi:hypothetical protein